MALVTSRGGGSSPSPRLLDEEAGKRDDGKVDIRKNEETVVRQALWLLAWTVNNIAVTMLNKAAFQRVDFKYPYALSTVHMACNIIGAQLYFYFSRTTKPKQLEGPHRISILWFSILFSLNIAIGNVSLQYVSVNFNQVFRSLVPSIVMGISMLYFKKVFSFSKKITIVPIVLGVALSTYGEMTFTTIGFVFTVLCVILAALKVIVSGELLTGELKLHPVDLLSKMCPLALLQIGIVSLLSGEVSDIIARSDELTKSGAFQVVLLSGITSFSLNLLSFQANKVTSPLTLTIAANVKQVLLMGLSTIYFQTPVSLINGLGIVVTILGSMQYSLVSVKEQLAQKSVGTS